MNRHLELIKELACFVINARKRRLKDELYNRLLDFDESKIINFTFQEDVRFDEFVGKVRLFFEIDLERVSNNDFRIDGKNITLPLTKTYFDYQILTSSVYSLLPLDAQERIYVWENGAWLVKFTDDELKDFKKRYHSIMNGRFLDEGPYSPLDRFIPGQCNFFDGVKYPYYGSKVSVPDFMDIYNDDEGPINERWRRMRWD